MSRQIRDGGSDTQKQRGLRAQRARRRAEIVDRDAVDFDTLDSGRVRTIDVSIEPQLATQIRSRRTESLHRQRYSQPLQWAFGDSAEGFEPADAALRRHTHWLIPQAPNRRGHPH